MVILNANIDYFCFSEYVNIDYFDMVNKIIMVIIVDMMVMEIMVILMILVNMVIMVNNDYW